jgi:hypothetical protein
MTVSPGMAERTPSRARLTGNAMRLREDVMCRYVAGRIAALMVGLAVGLCQSQHVGDSDHCVSPNPST